MRADYTCTICHKVAAAQRRRPNGWILVDEEGGAVGLLCGWECARLYMTGCVPSVDLISTAEAATYLGISPREVRQLAQRERLPAQRIGARALAFTPADLEAYRRDPRGRKPKLEAPVEAL